MSLFLLLKSAVTKDETRVITGGIASEIFKATEQTDLYINSAVSGRIVFLINQLSVGAEAFYARSVNGKYTGYGDGHPLLFNDAKMEVKIKLPQGASVSYSYSVIPSNMCMSGIYVDTTPNKVKQFTTENDSMDSCYFWAPYAKKLQFKIRDTSLGNSHLSVYKDELSFARFDQVSGTETKEWSIPDDRPYVFRLEAADSTHIFATVEVKSEAQPNVLKIHDQVPTGVQGSAGRFTYSWILPTLGFIPPLVLLGAWIYTFVVFKKN